MKRLFFILLTAVLLLALGCGKSTEQPAEKVVKLSEQPVEKVPEKTPGKPEEKQAMPASEQPVEEATEKPTPEPVTDISGEGIEPTEAPVEQEQVSSLNDESQPYFGNVI